MSMCALPCALLTWSLFCAEGPIAPQPNLGLFHCVGPPSFEVLLARGLTFWVPTHASQSLVTRPGGVSTFLSYHARGSPLVIALSWVVSVSGSPSSGVDTSQVRISPTGARTYGLEATFLFSLLLFWTVEAQSLLATSLLGDASLGRCLSEAVTRALNLLTFFLGSLEGSHHVLTLIFGQRPGTGWYTSPTILRWHLF